MHGTKWPSPPLYIRRGANARTSMIDPNDTPPAMPPDPNAGWSAVPNAPPPAAAYPPAGGYPQGGPYPPPGQYPPAGQYAAGQYPPPSQYPPAGQYPPPGVYPPAASGLSSTAAAGISYLTFIPAVIFLVMDPYKRDPFLRFHAWQELALTIVAVASSVVLHFLGFVGIALNGLVQLVLFVFWIIAIIKAFNGQRWKIPGVGDLAESLSSSV